MNEFQVQVEKITGQGAEDKASGVFSARVSFLDGSIGTFVSCIFVKSREEGVSAYIKDIFDVANKKLEGATSGSLNALLEAGEASKGIISSRKLESSFAQVLFYKGASYIFRFGDKVKVVAYLAEKHQELTFEHGSGHLKNGQVFLIATDKFISNFNIDSYLKEANIKLEEVVDGLATEISAKDDQSELGAALVSVREEESVTAVADAGNEVENKSEQRSEFSREDGEHLRVEPNVTATGAKAIMDPEHELEAGDEANIAVEDEKELGVSDEVEVDQDKVQHNSGLSEFKNPVFALLTSFRKNISNFSFASLKNRRTVVALGIVMLLILGGSAAFNLKGTADRGKLNEINGYLNSAASKCEEGSALIGLNQDKARVILSEASDNIKMALALDSENNEALELESKILAKLKEAEVKASVDLVTIATLDSELLSLSKNEANLVGVTNSTVYEVILGSNEVSDFDGPEGAVDGSVYDNKTFVFDGINITRVDLSDGTSEQIIEGQSAQDIAVFLGNVYLLGDDQIYKYVPTEEGYAQSADYLNESISIDDNGRLAIDGSIWVSNGSNLYEYLRGEKEDFEISGLANGVGNLGEIFTDSDTSNVYVVDHENSALLVFDKDGLYKQAYQSSEFAKARGLVVDEESGKFYIAVGSEVLEGNL